MISSIFTVLSILMLGEVAGDLFVCVDDGDCTAFDQDSKCIKLKIGGQVLGEGICRRNVLVAGDVCGTVGGVGYYEDRECGDGLVCQSAGYFADFKQASDMVAYAVTSYLKEVKTCQVVPPPPYQCNYNNIAINHGGSIRLNGVTIKCAFGMVISTFYTPCNDRLACQTHEDCPSGVCDITEVGPRCTDDTPGIHPVTNGTCESRGDDESLCSANSHCGEQQFCDVATSTCKSKIATGEPCDLSGSIPCEDGATCTGFDGFWGDYTPATQLHCEPELSIGRFCGYNTHRPNDVPTAKCEQGTTCMKTDGVVYEWFLTCQPDPPVYIEGPRNDKPIPRVDGVCQKDTDCPGDDTICVKYLNPVNEEALREGVCGPRRLKVGGTCVGAPEVYPYEPRLHECPENSECTALERDYSDTGVGSVMVYKESVQLCKAPVVSKRPCMDPVTGNITQHGRSQYFDVSGQCRCYDGVFDCVSVLGCEDTTNGCCVSNSDCGVNERCTTDARRDCKPLLALGEACDGVLFQCGVDLWCGAGNVCQERVPGGMACTSSESCEVGYVCEAFNSMFQEDVKVCRPVDATEAPEVATPTPETPFPATPQPETPVPETPYPTTPEPGVPADDTSEPLKSTDAPTPLPTTPMPETPVPETASPTPSPLSAPSPPSSSRATSVGVFFAVIGSVLLVGFIAYYAFWRGPRGANGDFVEMTAVG